MSKIKLRIVQKRTLLIIGEGADEKAFLSYLKADIPHPSYSELAYKRI